ncbi:uncharacterized protein PAC_10823 [Phialocephala subalpina]|uniref:Uncharacterized protein n=1 Tax=Phialocephala subalpina TaxID=576137 RepID=A0A1L7X7F0_9HELO|nr:uncharacterized protein PAC_10823 [Phialocephala subalpina]
MLPRALLFLAGSLLMEGVAAASAPTCVSSAEGYPVGQVNYLFNAFCNQLASNNFATEQQIYGLPVISFDFAAASSSSTCDKTNCLASFQTLITSCQLPNATIWGTGSLDAGCGTYNFTIWNTALNPITLGAATTTLQGATMTTAPIITTTSSPVSSTTSALVTSTTSTSATLSESSIETSLSQFYAYSNETSTASSSGSASSTVVSTTVDGSVVATTIPVSKTTATTRASGTKPVVGSTALGTSGADILRASGFSLVAVACMFSWYF